MNEPIQTTKGFPLSVHPESGTYPSPPTVTWSGAEEGAQIITHVPQTTAPMTDWDAESAGFDCEPGVGLTVQDDITGASQGSRWLCWSEVIAFHKWLGHKIEDGNR